MITPSSTIVTVYTLPAKQNGYYFLSYNAASKVIKACRWVTGETKAPATLEGFTTWNQVKTRVSSLGLTGLPEEDPKV